MRRTGKRRGRAARVLPALTAVRGYRERGRVQRNRPHASPSVLCPPLQADVAVAFSTSPSASALQWLEPQQTAGGQHPYLFSQCQVSCPPGASAPPSLSRSLLNHPLVTGDPCQVFLSLPGHSGGENDLHSGRHRAGGADGVDEVQEALQAWRGWSLGAEEVVGSWALCFQ